MKLAYSTNAFTRTDVHTALRAIADIGFAGAEILCDRPHWFPGEVNEEQADAVANLLRERGLGVSNLNVNTANGYFSPPPPENVFEPSLSNPEPALRRWREDYTVAALKLAKRIGASCVSVTSGHPHCEHLPRESMHRLTDSLARVCEAAEQLDVRIGVEYEPGLLVERARELASLIGDVGSTHLGANLDVGHSYLDGETPEVAIELLAGRIWNVHVEDIANRKHYHLVPGQGDLPFARYFRALRDNDYTGYLTVELYTYTHMPREAGEQSLRFLADLLDALGMSE